MALAAVVRKIPMNVRRVKPVNLQLFRTTSSIESRIENATQEILADLKSKESFLRLIWCGVVSTITYVVLVDHSLEEKHQALAKSVEEMKKKLDEMNVDR